MNELWGRRCSENFGKQLRYWNLIGKNSGLMFFVYAMILAGGFYYKKWLDSLPPHFPAGLLLTLLFTFLVVQSPIRTFLQRADLVFLLPAETELKSYFRKSCIYSFFMQSLVLLVFLIIGAPLYFHSGASHYLFASLAVFVVKAWNVDGYWAQQRIPDALPLTLLRTALSFLFLFSVFERVSLLVPAVSLLVLLFCTVVLFHRQAAAGLMNWARVIEMDERQAMKFLRFANLFTDVPQLRRRIRARKWLTRFFPINHFEPQEVYRQLFIKTFIRSDDYLGMYSRLTLIGGLVGYAAHFGYFTVFIVVSALYLTGIQILPMWHQSFPQALEGMYPIPRLIKKKAFIRLAFLLLAAEDLLISAACALRDYNLLAFLLFLVSGALVDYLFTYGYMARKLSKTADR
ncbi:MAG: ABC transporter permease [Sporolactobacillus sp.]